MRWLGLFTNKTFRRHLKLIFPHRDFIICIVSLAIFHPHFVIRIFPSAFYHPHFSIRIFLSYVRHPPSAICHPPPSGPHFTETQFFHRIQSGQALFFISKCITGFFSRKQPSLMIAHIVHETRVTFTFCLYIVMFCSVYFLCEAPLG